jgi:hypothetical protein
MKPKTFIKPEKWIFLALLAIPVLIISCNEDDGDEPDPLVGIYVFSKATFGETVNIKIQDITVTFNSGDDASSFVAEGLLGAAPCDDSTNAAIEFRENGDSYYVCLNETNESKMGTWMINPDRTTFTLNISNPRTLSVDIVNLNITETTIAGTVENFPLPLTTSAELGAMIGDPPTPNFQVKEVDVSFTRMQ